MSEVPKVPSRTAYSCTVTNWPLALSGAAIGVALIAVYAAATKHPVGALVGGAVVVVTSLEFSTVRLVAGRNGVLVRYGALGWPRFRFAREHIAAASAQTLSLARIGGLGLHWSPWRGTRMTVRSGPTLRLTLTSGSHVDISARDPAAAVAVLGPDAVTREAGS